MSMMAGNPEGDSIEQAQLFVDKRGRFDVSEELV